MRRLLQLALVGCLLPIGAAPSLAQKLTSQQQIDLAVLPAPPDRRAGATVLGYNPLGDLVTLREGTNDYVCLADEPGDERFSAACYHASLAPFMERGRQLRAEGKSRDEVAAIREEEALAGDLAMPEQAAMLYVTDGQMANYDPATGEISETRTRYVVYLPYATAETTGLPPQAPAGEPWIMDEGKPWAHIMLIPRQ